MEEKNPDITLDSNQMLPEDYPFWLRAPFRLLTDITQFRKINPWDLEIAELITRFVQEMKLLPDFNFPVVGRAILSAAILYRTKVSDLIRLIEETDEEKEDLQALGFDIPEISPSYHLSQRPVSFSELIYAFQGLLKQEVRYKHRLALDQRRALIQPLQLPTIPLNMLEEETTKIVKLKTDIYRLLVKLYEKHKRPIDFIELIKANTSKVALIRIFLCILFLCFELKTKIIQEEDLGPIMLIPIRDNEEEFLGGLEQIIAKKLKEGGDKEGGVTIAEVELEEEEFTEDVMLQDEPKD